MQRQILPAVSRRGDRSYRYFSDTWGVVGNTYRARLHPSDLQLSGSFEGRVRYYKQNSADFYSDLFPFAD